MSIALPHDSAFIAFAQEPRDRTPPTAPSDIDRLQGKWLLVSAERNGKRIGRTNANPFILTVTEGELVNNRFPDTRYTLRVDVSRKPRHIDQFLPVLKKWQRGIYEIDENKLRICWVSRDNRRLATFATSQGDSRLLQEFRKHSDQK